MWAFLPTRLHVCSNAVELYKWLLRWKLKKADLPTFWQAHCFGLVYYFGIAWGSCLRWLRFFRFLFSLILLYIRPSCALNGCSSLHQNLSLSTYLYQEAVMNFTQCFACKSHVPCTVYGWLFFPVRWNLHCYCHSCIQSGHWHILSSEFYRHSYIFNDRLHRYPNNSLISIPI